MGSCPRCGNVNRGVARYCAQCGLALSAGESGSREAGRVARPDALAVPEGYARVERSADLYYRLESAWGGRRLLDTENIGLVVFNAGYPLRHVLLRVRSGGGARGTYEGAYTAAVVPTGVPTLIEIPSWDMPTSVSNVTVELAGAEFEWSGT